MVSLTMNETFPVNCSGSYPSKEVQITTYSLLMASSLFGNLLVVGVFYKNETLRTTVHYFIMNMAVSDLLFPLVYLPYCIVTTYLDDEWLIQGIVGNVLCKLVWTSKYISSGVSVISMVIIAVDRFYGVLFSMKPPFFSPKKCRFIIVLGWFATVLVCTPLFLVVKLVSDGSNSFRCDLKRDEASLEMTMITAGLILSFCFTFGSAVIVTVLYSSIVVRLYRQKWQFNLATVQIQRRTKKNRQITWMLLCVVIVFYFVSIQRNLANIILGLKVEITLPCILFWFGYDAIVPLYTAVNPVVYYIFNEKYRNGYKDLLCCFCPCRAPPVKTNRIEAQR